MKRLAAELISLGSWFLWLSMLFLLKQQPYERKTSIWPSCPFLPSFCRSWSQSKSRRKTFWKKSSPLFSSALLAYESLQVKKYLGLRPHFSFVARLVERTSLASFSGFQGQHFSSRLATVFLCLAWLEFGPERISPEPRRSGRSSSRNQFVQVNFLASLKK